MSKLPAPEILLERGAVIVVNKPGGLLTQGPPGIDSLELRVKQFLIERENKPGKCYLGVPHRLDRPVSGVMVVVKNVRAAKRISEQIRDHSVLKKYWAWVEGIVDPTLAQAAWVDWMRKIPDEAKSEIFENNHPDAKRAELSMSVLQAVTCPQHGPRSLIEVQLKTGRTHQIRLQCAARNHPILGDALYGATTEFGPQTLDLRKRWIALHARELGFKHPIDKEPVHEVCPLPSHWSDLDSMPDDSAESNL